MITVWSGPGWYAANKNEQVNGQTIHRKRYEIGEKPFLEMSRECDKDPDLVLHGSPTLSMPYVHKSSPLWIQGPDFPVPWKIESWEELDDAIEHYYWTILDLAKGNDHRNLLAYVRLLGELCTARCLEARRVSYYTMGL